ncbi:hypothetical protein KA005_15390, partial [bacterium]|nr:hypothetical protein [bacterium]
MSLKLKLKNPDSCDGCEQLKNLATLGGHKQCKHYKINMLPLDDVTVMLRKQEGKDCGKVPRPQICKSENK